MIDIELDHIRAIAEDDIRASKCGYGCHVCGSFWTNTGYGKEWHEPGCVAVRVKELEAEVAEERRAYELWRSQSSTDHAALVAVTVRAERAEAALAKAQADRTAAQVIANTERTANSMLKADLATFGAIERDCDCPKDACATVRARYHLALKEGNEWRLKAGDMLFMTKGTAKLREALEQIACIQNNDRGGDWDEIEEARNIAREALKCLPHT